MWRRIFPVSSLLQMKCLIPTPHHPPRKQTDTLDLLGLAEMRCSSGIPGDIWLAARPQRSPHLLCPLPCKTPRQIDDCWAEGGNLWLGSRVNSNDNSLQGAAGGSAGGVGGGGHDVSLPLHPAAPTSEGSSCVCPLPVTLTYNRTITQLDFLNPLALWLPPGGGEWRSLPQHITESGESPKWPTFPVAGRTMPFAGSVPAGMAMGGWGVGVAGRAPPLPAPFPPHNNHLVAMAMRLINAFVCYNYNVGPTQGALIFPSFKSQPLVFYFAHGCHPPKKEKKMHKW